MRTPSLGLEDFVVPLFVSAVCIVAGSAMRAYDSYFLS